ncbi:MAG: hypothetical protein ACRCSL_04710 [Microbacterium sp.]
MSQQHRPLTGMTLAGSPATPPVVVPSNAPIVIHQIDASSPTNFLDEVTLFVANTDPNTDQTVRIVVAGGPNIDIVVPQGSVRAIFSEQPFFGVPGQAAQSQITLQNVTAQPGDPMIAWGFFTR